ncbi:MAG TPA: SIS domain-containing protein [Gaiellales bacterium]|jgi:fructoselysine-6-P-deglycase FrlB-like protein|nr:SIS domain-containing protein [Gaiellales bacterium]
MSAIEQEVASQPDVWAEAAALAATDGLPPHGARIAVIGCGTSLFVGQSYAAAREEVGAGESDAFAASEFPAGRRYDAVVAISRSGTTTEVLDVLRSLPGTPTLAVTAVAESPIAAAAERAVALPFADERSVVQTRAATAVLVMLRAHLGFDPASSIEAARRVLAAPHPVAPEAFDRFHFLGRGWTLGLASEAALKLREAGQAWAEAYPAMEYRHGPIALADEHTAVLPLGPIDGPLADDVRRTGATLVALDPDPLAALVAAQRLAVALAQLKGLDPDLPRNLTRSVVLQ